MEFLHVAYKELPLNEDNIFWTNFTKNKKVEQISFKKLKLHAISGLSIDWDSTSNVSLPNVQRRKALRGILRIYVEEKKKFNLDLNLYNEDYFDIIVPFVKRTDVLINGVKCYDTTAQKEEIIEFYNYYDHLKKFWFYVGALAHRI